MNEKTLMLVLVGGRSTPAVLAVLALKPNIVGFITSNDQPDQETEIKKVLEQIPDLELSISESVPAFDKHPTYEACSRIVQAVGAKQVLLNAASATKAMAIGMYDYGRKHDFPVYYVDTMGNRVIDLVSSEEHPLPGLTVADFLSCFGRQLHEKRSEEVWDENAPTAQTLVDMGSPALSVLSYVRQYGGGKGKRTKTIRRSYEPSSDELEVWAFLQRQNLLSGFEMSPGGFRFTIPNNDAFTFLSGGWLESYVGAIAKGLRNQNNDPFFDDVKIGFEIPDRTGAKKEVDVGMMYGGQFIHVSCKSGSENPWKTQYLDELRTVSSLVGGNFCSRIFVTAQPEPAKNSGGCRGYQHFLKQAKDRKIVVVTGDQLLEMSQVLQKEATRPTFPRV